MFEALCKKIISFILTETFNGLTMAWGKVNSMLSYVSVTNNTPKYGSDFLILPLSFLKDEKK